MRLTDWTNYTLRVLMYCGIHGAFGGARLVTIAEMAERYGVSRNHLMKIVNELARQGLLETVRGRSGGLRLAQSAQSAQAIRLGAVVRASEHDFRLVECFDAATDTCPLTPVCRLKRTLRTALDAYLAKLDAVTLADLLPAARSMNRALNAPAAMRFMAPPGRSSAATTHRRSQSARAALRLADE